MYARYIRNFAIGKSTHIVEVYERYTDENGLVGNPVYSRESGRINDCLSGLPVNKTQIQLLRNLARNREDMIVHPDGKLTNT